MRAGARGVHVFCSLWCVRWWGNVCVCECGQGLTTQAHKDVHTSNTLNTLDTINSFFKILHLIYVLITVPDTVPDIVQYH